MFTIIHFYNANTVPTLLTVKFKNPLNSINMAILLTKLINIFLIFNVDGSI
jgi:hypothetical protein